MRDSHNLVLLPEEILFRWFPGYATHAPPPLQYKLHIISIQIVCDKFFRTMFPSKSNIGQNIKTLVAIKKVSLKIKTNGY